MNAIAVVTTKNAAYQVVAQVAGQEIILPCTSLEQAMHFAEVINECKWLRS